MICHAYYGFTLSIASEIILGVNSLDKKIHKYFDGVVVDNKNRKYKYIIPHESFNYFLTLNKSEYVKKCINHLLLNITKGTKNNVKDVVFFGDVDTFQLISKASSENEGWMKSTKAMEISGLGCVVQVTTQQRNPDGSYALTDAVTFVKKARIECEKNKKGEIVSRKLVY